MKKTRKTISVLLVLTMLLSMSISVFADFKDTSKHWANKEISYLAEKAILNGYPDGTFKPQNNVTRAEVYKIINTLMGYTEESNVSFLDVKKGDWFYQDVARGVKAGYINANIDMNLKPNIPATRQEVARIIGIAFGLSKYESNSAKEFLDEKMILEQIKGYISILKDKGYIAGYPDGNFKPDGLITRAEVSKMIKNISGEILVRPGKLSKDIEGNLLIATDGVVLKNMRIKGDLYLSQGLGKGTLRLDNVIVEGNIIDRNSGAGSIKTEGSSSLEEKVLVKTDPIVDEKISATAINKGASLGDSKLSGSFKNQAGQRVSGSLEWVTPTVLESGRGLYDWLFIPDDTNSYNTRSGRVIVNINQTIVSKSDPIEDEKVSATVINNGETLADSKLSGSFKNQEGQRVTGTLEWTSLTPIKGIRSQYDWTFTPDDINIYNIIVGKTIVNVKPTSTAKTDPLVDEKIIATPIYPKETLADSKLSGSFKNQTGQRVAGRLEWTNPTTVERGRDTYDWTFTPDEINTYNIISGKVIVNINAYFTPKTDPIVDEKVKATPINRGQTIEDSRLSGSFKNSYGRNIPGKLEWDRQRGDGNRGLYHWKFTPVDSGIYNIVTGVTTVIINEIEKTDPIIDIQVKATAINRGDGLENSKLSGAFIDQEGNPISGRLEWNRQRGDGVRDLYTWIFIPDDMTKYNTIGDIVLVPIY